MNVKEILLNWMNENGYNKIFCDADDSESCCEELLGCSKKEMLKCEYFTRECNPYKKIKYSEKKHYSNWHSISGNDEFFTPRCWGSFFSSVDIVKQYLEKNGYNGLTFDPDFEWHCECKLDNLMQGHEDGDINGDICNCYSMDECKPAILEVLK